MSESTASLSLAERWTITKICGLLNSVLTYSLLTDVLLQSLKQLECVSMNNQTIEFLRLTFQQIK